MRLPDPSFRRSRLALPFAGAALLGLAALSASCVEAINATGYTDAPAELCTLVDRCYGGAFLNCEGTVAAVVDHFGERRSEDWLALAFDASCLESCNGMRRCLDFSPICHGTEFDRSCSVDDGCCGASLGTAACRDGTCCNTLGASCLLDSDCCPNTGFCDTMTHTCGGVICSAAGDACVNDFQCCSGRCDDDVCALVTCSPDAFECRTGDECCSQYCDAVTRLCGVPPCGVAGAPCTDASQCCEDSFPVCYDGGGAGGVCSTEDCSPNNSDCANDDQCCSHHCIPEPYHLCGNCVGEGEPCSLASPCCDDLECIGNTCGHTPD